MARFGRRFPVPTLRRRFKRGRPGGTGPAMTPKQLDTIATVTAGMTMTVKRFRALDATVVATPVLSKTLFLPRALNGLVTMTPAMQRRMTVGAAVTSPMTATLSRLIRSVRQIDATSTLSPAMLMTRFFARVMSAAAPVTPTLGRLAMYKRAVDTAAAVTPAMSPRVTYLKSLAATVVLTPTLAKTRIVPRTIAALLSPSGYYDLIKTTSGLVSYYRLNEASGVTAVDDMSVSDAAWSGSPMLGVAGIVPGDKAATLASVTTDRAVAPNVAAQNVGDVFTFEAWIKSTIATYSSIMSLGIGGPVFRIEPTGKLNILKSNVTDMGKSTVNINDGNPHHIVWTKNGATNKIYVDSADVTGAITNATMINPATGLAIGADYFGSSYTSFPFTGTIDEAALYNVALSAAQVLAHYNAGIAPSGGVAMTYVKSSGSTVLAATTTLTATMLKRVSKQMGVTTVLSPSVVKSLFKQLSATVTVVPTMSPLSLRKITFAVSSAVTAALLTKLKAIRSFTVSSTVTPTLAPLKSRFLQLDSTTTVTATMVRRYTAVRSFAVVMILTPVLGRVALYKRTFAAALPLVPTLSRKTNLTLGVSTPVTAALARIPVVLRALSTSVSAVPTLARLARYLRVENALSTISPGFARLLLAKRAFPTTTTLAPVIQRKVSKTFVAASVFVPAILKKNIYSRSLAAVSSVIALFTRQPFRVRQISASALFDPTLSNKQKLNIVMASDVSFIAGLIRLVFRSKVKPPITTGSIAKIPPGHTAHDEFGKISRSPGGRT